MPKQKTHRPSQDEIIRDCAKEVSEGLAEIFGLTSISPEVLYGLSGFLQVAVSILSEQAHVACETEEKLDERTE